eukprot:Skav221087  [mRNA]  locus=scaffold1024:16516:17196:+ [translate_table: standard]
MEAWKTASPPMDKQQQRYKKDVPADDAPQAPQVPELKICQFSNGKLIIPRDIRQHFMQCPLFGPEWRELITQFDKDWGCVAAADPQAPPSSNQAKEENPRSAKLEPMTEFKMEPPVHWDAVFTEAPKTLEKLKEKSGADLTEMVGVSPQCSFFLAPGPQLYIMAKEPLHIRAMDAPIITHGAGSWLTGDKATKYLTSSPDRGIPCKFESDETCCVFVEEFGFSKVL